MDDVQALPYIEWDSRSYFARLNAIGQFSLAWFKKASVVFEEKVFPMAMSRSLISGNQGYVSNREHFTVKDNHQEKYALGLYSECLLFV